MLKNPMSRRAALLVCLIMLALPLCGLRVFAAEGAVSQCDTVSAGANVSRSGSSDIPATDTPAITAAPLPPNPDDMRDELYPADVQAIIGGDTRQIIKTYVLSSEQTPADITRDGFIRDGWQYELTDITEKRTSGTDTRSHTETVTIDTDSKDLNAIIARLSPTLDYQGEDGYTGVLTLDLSTVKCEEAGSKTSSYTVSATREYPHLSSPDLSLVPKTITDNGRTLTLENISWETQSAVAIDYEQVPESYRAIAKYTGTGYKTVVTGYVTTADYCGEVVKIITGDTVYTVYFEGVEINPPPPPTPKPTETPAPTATPEPTNKPVPSATGSAAAPKAQGYESGSFPALPIITGIAILALLAGAGAYFFLRRNVRIYRDDFSVLAAKDRITTKSPVIDLSPLEGDSFGLVIDKFAAKSLNGATVEVKKNSTVLKHKIAYEGNAYKIEADFGAGTIQAIY